MTTAPKQDTQPAEAIAAAAQPAEAIAAPVGGLSLRKNFSWTFVGNVVYAACQWGILVVLAKLGTPEMVGQFALGLAVTAPVMMFSMLQLRGVQATDAKREYQFGDYLALRLITTALALAAIGGIVALGGYRRETALVILIIGALKGIDALSDVYYGLWQQHERMDGIAQALMVNGVVSTAALAALMLATRNIVLATLGSATGSLAAFLFTLARNRRLALTPRPAARPRLRWRPVWRLTILAVPLGSASLLNSLSSNIPRLLVEKQLGAAALGIYAAISYLVVAGTTVTTALTQSAMPRLAQLFAENLVLSFRQLISRLVLLVIAIGAAGLLLAALGGKFLLSIIYQPTYAQYASVFTWIMGSAILTYVAYVMNSSLMATRKFSAHLFIVTGVAVITSVSAYTFIPSVGLYGVVWASILGSLFQVAASLFFVFKAIISVRKSSVS